MRRNGIMDWMTPNTSTLSRVCTFPVFGSGFRISRDLPRDTAISCVFEPEKLPWTACVMPLPRCRVRLYRCMIGGGQVSGCFFLSNNGGRADWRTISKTTNAGRRLRTDSYRLQSYDFNDQYRFFDTSSEGVWRPCKYDLETQSFPKDERDH